ncbi:hypothetical protein SHKM778_22210 [Streptomyces sp. KM77-8]|uniref:Uncharacterized protein n=1 Tax=Streptomyces haneummycinicus TaxID=3074435 RepID=A0AAT9HEW6_9ACTN
MVPPSSAFAAAEGLQGVTIVEVVAGELDQPRGDLSVVVRPDRLWLDSGSGIAYEGEPDALSLPAAEALARQLAPLRLGGGDDDEPSSPTWTSPNCSVSGTRRRWTSRGPGGRGRPRSVCGFRSVSARTAGP